MGGICGADQPRTFLDVYYHENLFCQINYSIIISWPKSTN